MTQLLTKPRAAESVKALDDTEMNSDFGTEAALFEPNEFSAEGKPWVAALEAWTKDPSSPDSYELRQWCHWMQQADGNKAAHNGGDDEAMARLPWLVRGDQLQDLLMHCPNDATKAQVSLDAFPMPMPSLWCWPDVVDELLNEAGVTHRDLAYRDLYVALLQQMQGKVLEQIEDVVQKMFASLVAQMLAENSEKHHVPYTWPRPVTDAPFSSLTEETPITLALRSMHWETVAPSESARPGDVERTYVRRVIDSTYNGVPIMPLTNETTLAQAEELEHEEMLAAVA